MEAGEISRKRFGRKNVSSRQLDILISYMESNKDMREWKISHLSDKETEIAKRKRRWGELTEILNKAGTGKTQNQWRKCWNDQKKNVRNKANRIKTRENCNEMPTEILNPTEERILSLIGNLSTVEEPMSNDMEFLMIEDALMDEEENLSIEEVMCSSENSNVEEAVSSEASPLTKLSPRPSLPEADQCGAVTTNLDHSSNHSAMGEPGFVPMGLEPHKAGLSNLNHSSNHSAMGLSSFVPMGLNPSNADLLNFDHSCNHSEMGQSGFVPMSLTPPKTGKSEENKVSNELNAVLENLKLQNDLLKRIAVANEQIAHACMIIACNTEEQRKETSLPSELLKDINQKLKYIYRQKSHENFF